MKSKVLTLGLTIVALTSLNATAQKRLASNERAKKTTTAASPKFMDNVVIENNTEVINSTTTDKKKYKVVDNNIQSASDEETAEDSKVAKNDIQNGKIAGNAALYSFIDDWYGTPYRYGGLDRKGIDCSAFTRELCSNIYGKRLQRTAAAQFNETEYVSSVSELKEGDLVFFKIRKRYISHVGIYLGNNKFVHASSSKGVVISSLTNAYWSRYYVGGGKIK